MAHPTSVLTHPMGMNFRGPRLGPGGTEVPHYQDSHQPKFTYGPMQDALMCKTVNGGTGFYNWQTNGTSTHHSSQIMTEWMPGDNGVNQLLFALTPAPSDTLETDQRLHGQHMFGLSMLNFKLRYDPDWREMFGSIRNADELLGNHINYMGIQKVEQRAIEDRGGADLYTDEQGYTIFGRHSLPNIWLAAGATGSSVGVGNNCYLLARRHRWVEDPRSRKDSPSDPATRARLGLKQGRKRVSDEEEDEYAEGYGKRVKPDMFPADGAADLAMADIYKAFADASTDADVATPLVLAEDTFGKRTTAVEHGQDWDPDTKDNGEEGEFYWSFDPYVSPLRTNPDPCLYTNSVGEGAPIHIGMVSHLVDVYPNNVTPDVQKRAQAALYPTERNKTYQKSLHKLDQFEIMVRVGVQGP